jgi:hypothetical protein
MVQVTGQLTFLLHPEHDPSLKLSPDTGNPKFDVVDGFLFVVFLYHPMPVAIHHSMIHEGESKTKDKKHLMPLTFWHRNLAFKF